MKNKNSITGFLFAILIMAATSCNDYLDLYPISSLNTGSFYSTQSDFELAANGAYNELRSLYNSNILYSLEGRSDNVSIDTGYDYGIMSRFSDDATTSELLAIWQGSWILVDRCNAILARIDDGTFDDEAYRSYYKGEALFLRGYAYFQLGAFFGGVPLIDRQMKVSEIKTTARSTQVETFTLAANDLYQATQLLPEAWKTDQLGRATKYAAKGILARLYLFQKKFSEARPLLSDIITSGKYQMAANYTNCFLDTYDNSPEHVFQIQFTSGGQGNGIPESLAPEMIVSDMFPQAGKSSYLYVSHDLYDSYEKGDLRRDISIQKGYTNKAGVKDTISCFYIKYAHGKMAAKKHDCDVNLPILRYTDVKLMYAEALNEAGYSSSGEAFTILNEIRNRAGLKALTSAEVPNQDAFRSAMDRERRSEFACEALRWFDLIRTDKAMTVMNAFLSTKNQGNGQYKMRDYQTIFAIPQNELNCNPDTKYLWQNPGY